MTLKQALNLVLDLAQEYDMSGRKAGEDDAQLLGERDEAFKIFEAHVEGLGSEGEDRGTEASTQCRA